MSTMEPSFDNAPEWANFVAMDGDGEWYWFEEEPVWYLGSRQWRCQTFSNYKIACKSPLPEASTTLRWRHSKESI